MIAEKTKSGIQGFWDIVKSNLRNFSMFLVFGLIMIGFAFLEALNFVQRGPPAIIFGLSQILLRKTTLRM